MLHIPSSPPLPELSPPLPELSPQGGSGPGFAAGEEEEGRGWPPPLPLANEASLQPGEVVAAGQDGGWSSAKPAAACQLLFLGAPSFKLRGTQGAQTHPCVAEHVHRRTPGSHVSRALPPALPNPFSSRQGSRGCGKDRGLRSAQPAVRRWRLP